MQSDHFNVNKKAFTAIWNGDVKARDSYVDFKCDFTAQRGGERIFLEILCDSNYSAYINGKLVAFSACSDYPFAREYDKIDVTEYCEENNRLFVTVWHYGEDSQVYINVDAFLAYEIIQGGKTLAKSGKNTLSGVNPFYKNGYRKIITVQLGYSFLFDANGDDKAPFVNSEEQGEVIAAERKRKPLLLIGRATEKVEKRDGGYLIDFGRETVGYPDFSFTSPTEQKITVSYGEHLTDDGKVPRFIGDRDFSVEYIAKIGKNEYFNAFRRLACRYMFVKCEKDIEIDYIGLNQVVYPVKQKKFTLPDRLLQDIYDAGVRTLRCCMHEHYEDCPWREQALYALDSRNQMLCGYYAFEGNEYQRYNLTLLSKSLDGGLLSICAPSGVRLPIPFFSLMFFVQTYEYVLHTGDRSILEEVGKTLATLYKTFSERTDESGLIPVFPSPCWNFYEWSDGSSDCVKDERGCVIENQYDLILNCAYVYAMRAYGKLCGVITDVEKTVCAIEKTFFVKEKGMYKLSTITESYSQLGNAFALLIGLGDGALAEKTAACENMVPVTLSMNTFLYDALIARDEKYIDFIVEDIKNKYGKMLSGETGTFWETELGAADFGGAGSLCHGWSAIPVYFLHVLFDK